MQLNSMKEHPFGYFFAKKHPLNINTDDSCVFDTDLTSEI